MSPNAFSVANDVLGIVGGQLETATLAKGEVRNVEAVFYGSGYLDARIGFLENDVRFKPGAEIKRQVNW